MNWKFKKPAADAKMGRLKELHEQRISKEGTIAWYQEQLDSINKEIKRIEELK